MTRKCCVPRCRGNYDGNTKAHVFKFPNDPALQRKWVAAIHRENFLPSKHSVVCHLHFKETDIQWETSMIDANTGLTVSAPLKKPTLRKDAVPSVFDNYPSYLSKNRSAVSRKSPSEKRFEREAASLRASIEESLIENQLYEEKYSVKSFNEMKAKVKCIDKKMTWDILVKPSYILFLSIFVESDPHEIFYFTIDNELKVFVKGLHIEGKDFPIEISNIHEVENIMRKMEKMVENVIKRSSCSPNDTILDLLDKLHVEGG